MSLHLNDWHTGAVLAALDDPPPTVLSLHNLAYQGATDGSWLDRIGPRSAHFEWWGDTNPLSGAFALADRIVAVSPHYATEITTREGGFGLDEPLRTARRRRRRASSTASTPTCGTRRPTRSSTPTFDRGHAGPS